MSGVEVAAGAGISPTCRSMARGEGSDRRDAEVAFSLLVAVTIALLWAFVPEVAAGKIQYSDSSFHLSILQQMDDAVRAGGSVFDFWYDASPFGYPLFRVYQSLPHITMYGVYRLLGGAVPLETVFLASTVLFAALMPWSVYLMARKLEFPPLFSAFSGLISVLISEMGGYGMGMQNYSWGTNGIISQLWGVVFSAPAIGFGYEYLRTGRGLPVALLLVFLGCGSHLLSAHLIGFSLLVAALSLCKLQPPREVFARLGVFAVGSGIAIAHQLVTLVSDSRFVHQSVLEPAWKFSSHGVRWVYDRLTGGDLFDLDRYPVISLLVVVGVALCVVDVVKSSSATSRRQGVLLIGSFVVWLSLLAGYEAWGWLFSHLPVLKSMHMHRFIVGVHLFGVLLAARALWEVSRLVPSRLLVVALALVVLYPALKERKIIFESRHQWIAQAKTTAQEQADLDDLISVVRASPRGWVYAGFARDWGHKLKVAQASPLYHALTIAGIPTLGMLFHPFGLSGDVMFEFDPARRDRYDLFGVRYVVAPLAWDPPTFLKPVKSYSQYGLYEYPEGGVASLGRLAFEGWGTIAETAQFMRRWIVFGVAERGLYGEIVKGPTGAIPGIFFGSFHLQPIDPASRPIDGRIERSERRQEGASVDVVLNEPALVSLKLPFHPGWQIRLDGDVVHPRWITPGFIGVDMPVGAHQVTAHYRPFQAKGVLFLLSLAILVGWTATCLAKGIRLRFKRGM